MASSGRPVSRRHLVRALLGRELPETEESKRQAAASLHAAGDAAFAAGDFVGAVAAYRVSVRSDLSNTAVRTRLGQALYCLGQYIQARVEFEHVLRLSDGADGTARLGLGLTWLALGKTTKAGETLGVLADAAAPDLAAEVRSLTEALDNEGESLDLTARRQRLERLARAGGLLPESA